MCLKKKKKGFATISGGLLHSLCNILFPPKKIASEEDIALINSIYYFACSFLIETSCKGTKLHYKLVNYSTICNEIKRLGCFFLKKSQNRVNNFFWK
jgi:hypothetical protein